MLEDVALLKRIRLLRKLSVPIEDIRKLIEGELALKDCLDGRLTALNREAAGIVYMRQICQTMQEDQAAFNGIDAERYLEQMEQLEKGGMQFMDVERTDTKKQKLVPIAAAAVIVVLMLGILVIFWQLNKTDPAPAAIVPLLFAAPVVVIAGVIWACRERIKEIEGGEWNEARKY